MENIHPQYCPSYVPPVPMLFYPSDTRVQLVCHTDWRGMILPFAPVLALMAVCTYYAVLTRCSKIFVKLRQGSGKDRQGLVI